MSDANNMFSTLFEISKTRVSKSFSENRQGFTQVMQASGRALTCRPGSELGSVDAASRQITQSPPEAPHRAALGTTVGVFSASRGPARLPYSGEPSHRSCRVSRQPLLGGGAHLAAALDARGSRIFGYSNEAPPSLPWRQGRNPSAVEKIKKPSLKRATSAVEGPRAAPQILGTLAHPSGESWAPPLHVPFTRGNLGQGVGPTSCGARHTGLSK